MKNSILHDAINRSATAHTGVGMNNNYVEDFTPFGVPYPTWTPSTIITTTNSGYEPEPFLSVKKVENGFVVKKDGKEYICKTPEEIVEYLK